MAYDKKVRDQQRVEQQSLDMYGKNIAEKKLSSIQSKRSAHSKRQMVTKKNVSFHDTNNLNLQGPRQVASQNSQPNIEQSDTNKGSVLDLVQNKSGDISKTSIAKLYQQNSLGSSQTFKQAKIGNIITEGSNQKNKIQFSSRKENLMNETITSNMEIPVIDQDEKAPQKAAETFGKASN